MHRSCSNTTRRVTRLALLALVAVLPLLTGCVQRRMTIRSNPPGALVYVDDYEIGRTPCSTPFTYYGKRKFRLVLDGYETLTTEQRIMFPWYQVVGVDFVAENLVPWEIRDERDLVFNLQPLRNVPTEELLENAERLRAGSRMTGLVPAGGEPAILQTVPATASLLPPRGGAAPPGPGDPPGAVVGLAPRPSPPGDANTPREQNRSAATPVRWTTPNVRR
ncbi:MAG: PEGA domain-containing protein [Pirellulales bacterium]|nr:PEGA domain-containing protein [Pirellulales bacterium]